VKGSSQVYLFILEFPLARMNCNTQEKLMRHLLLLALTIFPGFAQQYDLEDYMRLLSGTGWVCCGKGEFAGFTRNQSE
jgi:hypothetical protein